MSEVIQPEQPSYPGEAWTEIVRRPTLEEFSRAFASDAVLEASVLSRPIVGPMGLWGFFQATRAMYDRLGFTHEIAYPGQGVGIVVDTETGPHYERGGGAPSDA